jgi:fused signal recognition particle receptor
MSNESDNQTPGWWGSTLGKLKSALARTKSNLVDPVLDEELQGQGEYAAEEQKAALSQEIEQQQIETVVSEPQVSAAITPTNVPHPVSAPAPLAVHPAPAPKPSAQMTVPRPAQRPAVPIDDDYLEELEEKLIRADLGLATAEALVQDLRKDARAKNWNSHDVEAFLKKEFGSMLATDDVSKLKYVPGKLNIYLVVGVNGTGKTTSIGKLAWRFKSEGKRVLMAAADTFRAAAESQLEIWSNRAGVEIVRLADGADPGAVVYQALEKANAENFEVLVIDTAGRLHNKANLMAELKKVRGVVEKKGGNANLESLLVLDASTGQNGLQQAKVFTEVCPLTGVILTKLDGTAKGGVVFSINRELKIPVKLIGLGEQIDDLRDFEPGLFVEALFQR